METRLMNTALVPRHHELVLAGPVGSVDAYLQRISALPLLSKEEEYRLAHRFRDEGDLDAARTLVISQLRFVAHIARSYLGYGLPLGDLIQEGNIGLMKAVKRFDPKVGVRLVSFAVHWIRAEIHEFILRNWRQVKIATTKAQRKLFFNLRKSKKHLGWLSHAETTAIANDLGVSAKEVTEMEKRLAGQDMAFDATGSTADEEHNYSPALYLSSAEPDPADVVEQANWQEQASDNLQLAMQKLDQRSREILQERWLGEKKTTLQKLAQRYDVSAERIRQIEHNAIRTLQSHLVAAA